MRSPTSPLPLALRPAGCVRVGKVKVAFRGPGGTSARRWTIETGRPSPEDARRGQRCGLRQRLGFGLRKSA